MSAALDPGFQGKDAFLSAFSVLPKDARLAYIDLVDFTTSGSEVVASVRVAIEFTLNGTLQRDTPRVVSWAFKRYD
jgi:hypothetical protein